MNRAKVGKAELETLTALQAAYASGDRDGCADAVWTLRARGWTWAEIGEAVGISRQAANKRWAEPTLRTFQRISERRSLARARDSFVTELGDERSARWLREADTPTEPSRSLAPVVKLKAQARGAGTGLPPGASEIGGALPCTSGSPLSGGAVPALDGSDQSGPPPGCESNITKGSGTVAAPGREWARCPACFEEVAPVDQDEHARRRHRFSRWADLAEYDPDE